MRIVHTKGMVNIDSDDFEYGNIRDMYTIGHGIGLSLSSELEHKRGELIDLFGKIADCLYEIEDITTKGTK